MQYELFFLISNDNKNILKLLRRSVVAKQSQEPHIDYI